MKRMTWASMAVALVLAGLLPGCFGGGEEEAVAGDEYAEAVPDTAMLALTLDGEETATQGLEVGTIEAALPGDPAAFKGHAGEVMENLNALLAETHSEIETLFAEVEPVTFSKGALDCKIWETDGPKVHWRLASCVKDKKLKKYAFVLKGRPLASTSDADYLIVVAGEGKVLPKQDDKKRGSGRIGYNFTNLNTLNGRPVAGKLGIGYRAAGNTRHLVIGLNHVTGPKLKTEMHGIYRYFRVLGKGGRFAFLGFGDYLAKEGEKLVIGQDQLDEFVKAVIGWRATGEARTVLAACGGSVGEDKCIRVAQCWSKDDSVTFDDQAGGDGSDKAPAWDATKCSEIPYSVEDLPGDDDLEPPESSDSEAGAPAMPEPDESFEG
ncbi:MAG: hypothetical protein FJ109_15405 [Deltaproteobacteria bacterium]|nr:hypothetical protein [Deltaproteobacteria bacterium]